MYWIPGSWYLACLGIWSAWNILGPASSVILGPDVDNILGFSWFNHSWPYWCNHLAQDLSSFHLSMYFPASVSSLASFPALFLQVLVTILVICQELTSYVRY